MPCVFSGIFYIESLSTNRQLQYHFKDEDNHIHTLNLIHFQSPDIANHPFLDAFQMVQSELVYFIIGTFAVHERENILVYSLIIYNLERCKLLAAISFHFML